MCDFWLLKVKYYNELSWWPEHTYKTLVCIGCTKVKLKVKKWEQIYFEAQNYLNAPVLHVLHSHIRTRMHKKIDNNYTRVLGHVNGVIVKLITERLISDPISLKFITESVCRNLIKGHHSENKRKLAKTRSKDAFPYVTSFEKNRTLIIYIFIFFFILK